MKIHIVCPDFGSDHSSQILPRLAHILADGTGWSIGTKPDPNADLQYFFPYLLFNGWSQTMAAAWFTHREEKSPDKTAHWDEAAGRVDLRTVSTELYADNLRRYGDTALVTPPLDRDKFNVRAKGAGSRPVVGISGYVQGSARDSGRKGEALVRQLAKDKTGFDLTVSGRGWPVQCRAYPWAAMQEFYQGLDVLLCTSLVEGPGYGPLEALACGVKVVVPLGVGIFDELPDAPGICRYKKGDYRNMRRALEEAIATKADPSALRETTARFTVEAWVEDHKRAFQRLLQPIPPPPSDLPDWRGNCGVYMVAYGGPARKCAATAIASWHRHMPGVPVCLASDRPLGPEDVFVEAKDADVGARSVKTRVYGLAPREWRYVVYVDADTEVIADVGFLFDLLADGWELAICYNPAQYVLAGNMIRPDNRAECEETFALVGTGEFLQMNGGVFGFRRCERTEEFFDDWHAEWQVYGKRDQAAFDRALYSGPLRIYTLGVEWNCVTRYVDASRSAGIVHRPTLARRWRGIIHSRLDTPQAWRDAGLR